RRHFLIEQSGGMPSVTTMGKPHYYFAGLQVDPAANRARALTNRGAASLQIFDVTTKQSVPVEIPAGSTVSGAVWSPDGKQLAFLANFERGSFIYLADAVTGKSRQLSESPVLATLVTSLDWTADGNAIAAVMVPEGRGPEPLRPAIATGPEVRLWLDSTRSPQPNYATLLEEPYDQNLLEYHVAGQLTLIDVRTKVARKVGAPAMISNVDPSPSGKYFRVTTMRKPFSYVVQYSSFGDVEELWDENGKVLAEVQKRPL